ncbi:MAG: serine/threonine-protein phosphatase [Chitinophagaceae bacterium]|nr:serine/threonine-protein phosphatase [Chitinophagaceae bacterium]
MKFPWKKKTGPVSNNGAVASHRQYAYRVYGFSETGPTRSSNEDSIIYFFPGNAKQTLFAMVADGMGGHNAGEVASHIACQVADEFVIQEYQHSDPAFMLESLLHAMHYAIRNTADNNDAYKGMGTTATMVFIQDEHFVFGHVGDSRLYHLHNNTLRQLTTDQTLVNQMVAEGKIEPCEAATHDMKHVLLQALGTVDKIEPEISAARAVQSGEYYFLCSDGIYDVLDHNELQSLFAMRQPVLIMECIKALCYRRNASDNVSALLIEIADNAGVTNNTVTREQNTML